MLIHISTVSGTPKSVVRRDEIIAMHTCSRTKRHTLTADPEIADLIVLAGDVESLTEASKNDLLTRYPEKTMAYSEIDALVAYVPGVYASAAQPKKLSLRRTQGNIYFSRYGSSMNAEVRCRLGEPKSLLFCFRGRRDCRIRANILDHSWGRSDVEVLQTTGYMHWKDGIVGKRQSQKDYADALARSHFALCPRGMGLGSIRLFEVMEMGVAPVLLADRYALPPGPDWGSFLLRVPEKEYARLPELLDAHVRESEERGRRAREAWQQFFAPEEVFDRVIEQMYEIRARRIIPEKLYRRMWLVMYLRERLKVHASRAIQSRRQS